MKNLPGFTLFWFVLVVAVVSVGVVFHIIAVRANEIVYYKQLNKERTTGFSGSTECKEAESWMCN